MPITASSGSSTSPVPVGTRRSLASATIIIASNRRKARSVRQSLANSTQARLSWSGKRSSFASSRSKRAKASAVDPAKPAMTLPLPTLRTFRAPPLMMVWPSVTCPSPATTTLPPLRTVRIVVPYQVSGEEWDGPIAQAISEERRRSSSFFDVNALIALRDLLAYMRAVRGSELLMPLRYCDSHAEAQQRNRGAAGGGQAPHQGDRDHGIRRPRRNRRL